MSSDTYQLSPLHKGILNNEGADLQINDLLASNEWKHETKIKKNKDYHQFDTNSQLDALADILIDMFLEQREKNAILGKDIRQIDEDD